MIKTIPLRNKALKTAEMVFRENNDNPPSSALSRPHLPETDHLDSDIIMMCSAKRM